MNKLLLLPLLLALPVCSAEQAVDLKQINSKVILLENVLADIKTNAGNLFNDNQLFKDGYLYAVKELEQGKASIANNELKQAAHYIEQSFVNMYYVKSLLPKASSKAKVTRHDYQHLRKTVDGFIESLTETLLTKNDDLGSEQLIKAKNSKILAEQLLDNNELKRAHLALQKSNDILIKALTRLKDKQTLLVSLYFATPKDEYQYEKKHLASYRLLLERRLANTAVSARQKKRINLFKEKSEIYVNKAESAQALQHYNQAITALENANASLVQALRVTGLTMF
tara:strand:- start:6722 stop:7570 length:849 start_codon:yes stop_codon:yes gene_type:complete